MEIPEYKVDESENMVVPGWMAETLATIFKQLMPISDTMGNGFWLTGELQLNLDDGMLGVLRFEDGTVVYRPLTEHVVWPDND